jgi:hypothetical protein
MKAIEVFRNLLERIHFLYQRSSPTKWRNGAVKSTPGEMIAQLSAEERLALQNLSSDDLVAEKLPRHDVQFHVENEIFYSNRYHDEYLREAKLEFDNKITKTKK